MAGAAKGVEWMYTEWYDFFYKEHTVQEYNVWNYTVPATIEPYWFEKCDLHERMEWFLENWTLCIKASVLYILMIVFLKNFMKDRPAYKLTGLLFVWNICHATYSIAAFSRTLPELLWILRQPEGFYRSICLRYAEKNNN